MNIQWLETFLAAARYENYHHASERLYLSQPTVTVHIRQLEKLLGVELFERSGRNVVLTSFGRAYVPHAEKVLASHRDGLSQINKKRQGYMRTLAIAVSPLIASSYLPHWVKVFSREHPETEVVIDVLESQHIGGAVEGGRADVGLSRMNHRSLTLSSDVIQTEKLAFVVPHDGGDAESSLPVGISEALSAHVLLTDNHPGYWEELRFICKRMVPSLREMKVSQVHVTKRFIEEGLGCSILPESSVRRELAEGRMMEADVRELQLPKASTYTVYKESSEETKDFLHVVHKLT